MNGLSRTITWHLLHLRRWKARDVKLPFAPSLKRVLSQSGQVADSFDSTTVNSEHVLLTLLGYDPKTARVPDDVDVDGDAKTRGYSKGALAVFLRMEEVDTKNFRAGELEVAKTIANKVEQKSHFIQVT